MEDEYFLGDNCPHCGDEWDGYECNTCGFSDTLPVNQYETPEGNIVVCTEDQAIERGYLDFCPSCAAIITWWELEDHEMCIDCWHNKNKGDTYEKEI